MELTHRFTVPTSVAEAWAHFNDIASVAECFPGASVTSVDADSFSGSVKVKLGPIALVYNGSGTFVEKDDAAHRFVVDAKGKDKRGNGTAGAKVTLEMADAGGSTDIAVFTDLAITGKPAQFGRGVMQDVSDKLLGQFVQCLEQRLADGATGVPDAAPPPAEPEVGPDPDSGPTSATGIVPDETDRSEPPHEPLRQGVPPAPARDDAIGLGSTVLPVLASRYWKVGVGVLAVAVGVIWWAVSRG